MQCQTGWLTNEIRQESLWTTMFADDDEMIFSESREQVDESLKRRRNVWREKEWISAQTRQKTCVNERETGGKVKLQGVCV